MKRAAFLFICIALVLVVIAPVPARAADSDFSIRFQLQPQSIGPGGAISQLFISVTNLGDTPITWLEVIVDTEEYFDELWFETIQPGANKFKTFEVQFSQADANVEKTLSVYINNNNTPGPDGVRECAFWMESIGVFSLTGDCAPMQEVYHPGDTVTLWFAYRNEFDTEATDVVSLKYLGTMQDGIIFRAPVAEFGTVEPGQTVITSFSYTFTEDDIGMVLSGTELHYRMQGILYTDLDDSFSFTVEEKAWDIAFSAALTATPEQIEAGDTVEFTITLKNSGGDDIDEYVVRSGEGGIIAATDGTAPGGTAHVTLNVPIYETGNISYVVEGRVDGDMVSHETNRVTVTVTEPEASAEVSASSEATAAPSEYSAKPTPAPHPQPTPWSLRPSAAAGEAAATPPAETDHTLVYIILGVAAAAVAAAAAIIILMMVRKKRAKPQP